MKMQQYFLSLLLMVHMQLSTTQKCSVLPRKCNNTFFLHCCKCSWSCQQYKSVQCCRGKRNNWFLFHCCRATKYFVLLTATVSIKHYERVSAFFSSLSHKKIPSFTSRITLSSVACLLLVCYSTSSHKQHGFGKKKMFNMECAL